MVKTSDIALLEERLEEIIDEFEEIRIEKKRIPRESQDDFEEYMMNLPSIRKAIENRYSKLSSEIVQMIHSCPEIRNSPKLQLLLSSTTMMEVRMEELRQERNRLRNEEIHLRINSSGALQQEGYKKNRISVMELSNTIEDILKQCPEIRDSEPFRRLESQVKQWRFDDSMDNSRGSSSGIFGLSSSNRGRSSNDDRSDSMNPNSHRYNPGR